MNKAFFTLAVTALLSAGAGASTLEAASSVSGYAADASASGGAQQVARRSFEGDRAERGTYYWLHPKLGHVKVDRRTHAMVIPGSASDRPASK